MPGCIAPGHYFFSDLADLDRSGGCDLVARDGLATFKQCAHLRCALHSERLWLFSVAVHNLEWLATLGEVASSPSLRVTATIEGCANDPVFK